MAGALDDEILHAMWGRPLYYIDYEEYHPSENFATWLSGYEARIRSNHGFRLDEPEKTKSEVVRTIDSKLSVGPALNAYNRLKVEDRDDYDRLVSRLMEEFTDPREKQRFNDSRRYNIRKKGQSLKDFMEEIKNDLKRYSDIPATILTVNGSIPNPEREKDGIRRFVEGIRDINGKKDKPFANHLKYRLQDDDETNWKNAIEVATAYETVFHKDKNDESDSEFLVEGVSKVTLKEKEATTISALTEVVCENQGRIENLEFALNQLSANQDAIMAKLDEISIKLDFLFAENDQREQNPPYHQDGWDQPQIASLSKRRNWCRKSENPVKDGRLF